MTLRSFLWSDCAELQRKQLLSDEELRQWEPLLRAAAASGDCSADVDPAALDAVRRRVRELFEQELDTLIDATRVRQNATHQQTLQQSDIVAVAAGGLLGALNAWMRPSPSPSPATSLWASAFDAAQASLNVVRQRRLLDHLRIRHLSGDETSSANVQLCINGFMTQGGDPLPNWRHWAPPGEGVVQYAVLWEAGDVDVWNEFCAHANENIKTSAAHELLTHFSGNPWHKAQDKAEQVGIVLAHVLAARPAFCRGRRITLLGHSLGAAVIYSLLNELAALRRRDGPRIDASRTLEGPVVSDALCFAGAFVPSVEGLANMAAELAPHGVLVNVFSRRDDVLSKLFWATQLHTRDAVAAGCAPLDWASSRVVNGVNVDVSELVPPRMTNQFGHSYAPHMQAIRARVLPHLPSSSFFSAPQ
ncbi:hypothetical protein P43SY_004472 [Pythium insidiosum]|uniref:Uncharacterized protein n=1 Tax=Pythium insidiosum TaxID=114742 RepID=A0AAD5LCG8_PYTIN|nr:hypothetical protein P43SY_004472 [Pythium insidiosum]